ncbi:MAG: hypothetical protein Q9183_005340 [Haloplaca sp. 2 TL-2023]
MPTGRRKRITKTADTADLDDIIKKMSTVNINDSLEKTGTGTDHVTEGTNTAHSNRNVKKTDNEANRMIERVRETIRKLQMTSKGTPMDTSHINRIGKKIDKSKRCPCCSPKGDENYEVYPSSIQVERQLNARIPFYKTPRICDSYKINKNNCRDYQICPDPILSSKQRKAVNAFQLLRRQFLQDAHSLRPFLDDLKQIGVIVDNFFFDGKLMERLSICWDSEMHDTLAYFAPAWVCDKHLQCHTGVLGFHCHVQWDGEITPAIRLEYFFQNMLHELCHAWIDIFTSKQTFSYTETIKELGFRGHGTWFQNLMYKCLAEGSAHFKLEHRDRHLQQDVVACPYWEQNDIAKFDELRLWAQKEGPDEIEKRMEKLESVSKAMIQDFQEARAKGADLDEAIYLMDVAPASRFSKAASTSAQRFYVLPTPATHKRKRNPKAQHKRRRGKRLRVKAPKPGRECTWDVGRLGQNSFGNKSIFSTDTSTLSDAAKKPAGQRSLSQRVASL